MNEKKMRINYFNKRSEEKQNPYIGFTSFQHFRDESLYSDIVVRPERNMTETENVEGYPIPDYVPQEGRNEGYYPDTSVAYIRIFWKDFEPRQGEYNYKLIEDILSMAKRCDQTVMLRLMAHSTRVSDDVPEWLKEIVSCPERPDGARVKDSPLDEFFLDLFGKAIQKIGERFDSNPVLDVVDISLPGAWGEGHKLELYSPKALEKLMDVYTNVFQKTHLIGQAISPDLINYANDTKPVGWRGDGVGNAWHMHEYYPKTESKIPDVWEKAPVSFESFWWLGEWKRRDWNIDEIIDLTLKWHISTFNAKSLPIPNEWIEKIEYWNSKMGYHFSIDYFKYPEKVARVDNINLELCITNSGVAPIYNPLPLKVRLINRNKSYLFETDIDIRQWFPGKAVEYMELALHDNMVTGKYTIEIGIGGDVFPMLYLCTDAIRNGEYYQVGEIEIVS